MLLKAIVEIIPNQDKRLFVEGQDFAVKNYQSSMQGDLAFSGFYGWLEGFGQPPGHHLDVFVLTDNTYDYGQVVECKLVGAFKNASGDHKMICLERDAQEHDFYDLPLEKRNSLRKIYSKGIRGDEWLGYEGAVGLIESHGLVKIRHL